jgi:hypothetical protein
MPLPSGHEPRLSIEPQPAGHQVTRIIGCSCGWQVPPDTEADTAFTWHAATAACHTRATAPDDPSSLQHDLVQRAIDHVLSDREADQRSTELTSIEETVAAHLRHHTRQPPDEEAPALLQNLQRAQALFHLADQHAIRCHEAFRRAAQQLVNTLEVNTLEVNTSTAQSNPDDLLLVTPDNLPPLDARFLAEVSRHSSLGTLVLELDGTLDKETLDWLTLLTKIHKPGSPIIVVIPPSMTPDRETRDKIVSSGGMPLYAPRIYDERAHKDARRRALSRYLKELRAATSLHNPRPYPEELRQTVRRPAGQLTRSPDHDTELPVSEPSKIALWRLINAYAVACGGDPSRNVQGNLMRQAAVVEIELHFSNQRHP